MFPLELCDVPGDGDCFYTCIARSLGREDEYVSALRSAVATLLIRDHQERKTLLRLCRLHRKCPEIVPVNDNPLLEGAKSLEDIAANIRSNGVWASQIEVGIVQRMLAETEQISLIVLEAGCQDAGDQMASCLGSVSSDRCMFLVRVDQCHYQYVRCHYGAGVHNTHWMRYFMVEAVTVGSSLLSFMEE